jgi:excisionase family DNA binding protein
MKSINQTAVIFGVTYRTIWNWINTGKIKAVKINGIVRIDESEIERLKKGE